MTRVIFLFICLIHTIRCIQWNGNWALDCDFPGNDIGQMVIKGEECSRQCELYRGCTHFAWSSYNGGTCWFKGGDVNKNDAIPSTQAKVCGYIDNIEALKGTLAWSDEFDSQYNFNQNWNQETGGHGWGNNELQYYTDNNRNTEINGMLTIHTRIESFGNNRYTSARLFSKRSFKYGIFEMRAKLPQGRGSWSAFWLLAAKRPLSWPADGEIDIMEHVGFEPNVVYTTIHCNKYFGSTGVGSPRKVDDVYGKFHNYQIYWSSKVIRGYVDGVKFFEYEKPKYQDPSVWPYDNEFNIILNSAVGGNWGGVKGVDDSAFPQRYTIDYVKVFKSR